jgi:hypothetical protein
MELIPGIGVIDKIPLRPANQTSRDNSEAALHGLRPLATYIRFHPRLVFFFAFFALFCGYYPCSLVRTTRLQSKTL